VFCFYKVLSITVKLSYVLCGIAFPKSMNFLMAEHRVCST